MTALVKQRTGHDCVVCCLAMLTGRAYEDVLAALGDTFDPKRGVCDDHGALERLDFDMAFDAGDRLGEAVVRHRGPLAPVYFGRMAWGRRALLSVPSLNNPGGWHMVYYDGRRLFDPSPNEIYETFEGLPVETMALFRETVA